jgi:hypothetical protein
VAEIPRTLAYTFGCPFGKAINPSRMDHLSDTLLNVLFTLVTPSNGQAGYDRVLTGVSSMAGEERNLIVAQFYASGLLANEEACRCHDSIFRSRGHLCIWQAS